MRPLLSVLAIAGTAALIAGCGGSSSTQTTTSVPTARVGSVAPCGPFKGRNASDIMIRPYTISCLDARGVILDYIRTRTAPKGWQCAPSKLTNRSTSGSCQPTDRQGGASATWKLTSAVE
jgi:hypothetical protein